MLNFNQDNAKQIILKFIQMLNIPLKLNNKKNILLLPNKLDIILKTPEIKNMQIII